MPDRYTIELYDPDGACISIHEVANSMLGFLVLAGLSGLLYAYASCYLHRLGEPPITQWELEIK